MTHGVETGIIRQLPNGEFVEEHRPLTEEERAPLAGKPSVELLPASGTGSGSGSGSSSEGGHGAGASSGAGFDGNGVPAPGSSGLAGRARAIANRAFAETVPLQPNGHGNGNGAGNGSGHDVGNGAGNGSGRVGRAGSERAAVEAGPDGPSPDD